MWRMLKWSLCVAAAALLSAGAASAQVTKYEIIQSLKPKTGLTRSMAPTRKIEIVPGHEAEVLDQNKDLPKINLSIEFEYNSDRPTTAGEQQLAQLADALKEPGLRGSRYMLAGHTDGRGGDDYNQVLSERRAMSVQRYLIQAVGFDPTKISTVGFGKRRLLEINDPASPRNRRVEVVNLLN
jgi:outer membrane protein OmpA-like peptidoglycan-associated protein